MQVTSFLIIVMRMAMIWMRRVMRMKMRIRVIFSSYKCETTFI